MTCHEYRSELMERARGAEPRGVLMAHVAECSVCARFLDEQQALTAALQGIASEEIPSADQMGARVMMEFDRGARHAKIRVLGWVAAAGLIAAASLFLFVAPPKPPTPPLLETSQFVPIPYTIPLSPEERATVVRMEIPVSALIAVGFRMQTADPGAVVQADVLVSQDGRARAIRPVDVSSSN
jgi:hypothetical protein